MATKSISFIYFCLLGCFLSASSSEAQNSTLNTTSEIWFEPEILLELKEGTQHLLHWSTNLNDVANISHHIHDTKVADVDGVGDVIGGDETNPSTTFHGYMNISAKFIGYNNLTIFLLDNNNQVIGNNTVKITVLLSYQNINQIFTICIGVLVALVYVNMGATLDMTVVKQIVKKPIGPIVGLACQYVLMPMIAFGLGLALFPDDKLLRLGMFLNGCSPGGGASNMWTYLLGGSLDLSIMMTFVSTIVAFAAVPLWVLTMGDVIMQGAAFVIPYTDIAVLVVSLIVPCAIGVAIQFFLPKIAKLLEKLLTPMSIFNIIFILTFGVYANRYVFSLFTWQIVVAGFGLPTLGYLSGMGLAWICRRNKADTIAIGIETGIQNSSVAIFILKFTLDKPAGDLTAVIPAASALMTPVPLILCYAVKVIYNRCVNYKSETITISKPELETQEATKSSKDVDSNGLAHVNGMYPHLNGFDNPAADFKDSAI